MKKFNVLYNQCIMNIKHVLTCLFVNQVKYLWCPLCSRKHSGQIGNRKCIYAGSFKNISLIQTRKMVGNFTTFHDVIRM